MFFLFMTKSNLSNNTDTSSRTVEVKIGDKIFSFGVLRYSPSVKKDHVPIEKMSRNTPLDSFLSLHTEMHNAKTKEDFDKITNYYDNPQQWQQHLAESHRSVEEFCRDAESASGQWEILGEVQYDKWKILAIRIKRDPAKGDGYLYVYSPWVEKSGVYYQGDVPGDFQAVIEKLVRERYSVFIESSVNTMESGPEKQRRWR